MRTSLCVAVFLLAGLGASAEDKSATPAKYRMELVYIFEGEKPESIIVIGNSGFKSAASLKNFVEKMPARSTLEWAPGCERFGGSPCSHLPRTWMTSKTFAKNITSISSSILLASRWRQPPDKQTKASGKTGNVPIAPWTSRQAGNRNL
jgi:hypothetical protein